MSLILANLRVPYIKPVKAGLEEHLEIIAVYHLPSYKPQLNSDERLNRSLQSTLSHLPSAKNERSLHKQIISRQVCCQKQPEWIRSFFDSISACIFFLRTGLIVTLAGLF